MTLLVFGDSNVQRLISFMPDDVTCSTHFAEPTERLKQILRHELRFDQYSHVALVVGSNDLGYGLTLEESTHNIQFMADYCRRKGCRVLIVETTTSSALNAAIDAMPFKCVQLSEKSHSLHFDVAESIRITEHILLWYDVVTDQSQ